jgi:hypothetical protein
MNCETRDEGGVCIISQEASAYIFSDRVQAAGFSLTLRESTETVRCKLWVFEKQVFGPLSRECATEEIGNLGAPFFLIVDHARRRMPFSSHEEDGAWRFPLWTWTLFLCERVSPLPMSFLAV